MMHSARGGVLIGLHFNLIYNFLDVGNSLPGFVRFVPLRSGSYATLQNERPIPGAVRDALVVQILVCLQRCFVICSSMPLFTKFLLPSQPCELPVSAFRIRKAGQN